MQVELRLFATLKKLLPTKNSAGTTIDVKEDATINDLINDFKIPRDIKLIIMVNGRKEKEDYKINDGDRIGIFPPVGGG